MVLYSMDHEQGARMLSVSIPPDIESHCRDAASHGWHTRLNTDESFILLVTLDFSMLWYGDAHDLHQAIRTVSTQIHCNAFDGCA